MRGLLCIEPLYHQIVAGNKTQTRRSGGLEAVNQHPDEYLKMSRMVDVRKLALEFANKTPEHYMVSFAHKDFGGCIKCTARYKVGEVLYLKEPIFIQYDRLYTDQTEILYKYDNKHPHVRQWSNKLFMPASAARAFIRITNIRCERLLDISDEDCLAEGIEHSDAFDQTFGLYYKDYKGDLGFATPKASFLSLYKLANKVKEVPNLWVWVYEFEYLPNYKP